MANSTIGIIGLILGMFESGDNLTKSMPSLSSNGCHGGRFSGIAKAKRLAQKVKNKRNGKKHG
ncbi:MAG: hypothetical protein PHO76_02625 [Methylotenera sp.]|nr:hypothetical protein [Methylotenera sp.]MDD4927238.1 hypothetical protein [Methylotenera sp.]